jgi:aryl-alcohol dehydrogenase-like predicted oxidoreductase
MKRRDFLKQSALTVATLAATQKFHASPLRPITRRRLGKTCEELSIIGFGGIVVMNEEQSKARNIVAEAVDRGVNYFDVSPDYDNAEERLGPALAPYRSRSFLACKTNGRLKDDARADLQSSLRRLQTDHIDLYQFHALTKMSDLDKVLGPGGAMETFEAAKKEGKIRYIGFSVHSQETAVAALNRYPFDTVLFPLNFVLWTQAKFGPGILETAQQKGIGILCLKSMAKTVWPSSEAHDHPAAPKCWYEPAAFPHEASLGLRWTLGHPITAAIPPGDERYFRLAMDVAQSYSPLNTTEEQVLLGGAVGAEPIFHLGNDI